MLNYLKKISKHLLPDRFKSSSELCQIYVGDDINTTYSFFNIFSILPQKKFQKMSVKFTFYKPNGTKVFSIINEFKKFNSKSYDPRKSFKGNIPSHGLVTFKLLFPFFSYNNFFVSEYINHFYTYFKSQNNSVGVVHTLARFNDLRTNDLYISSSLYLLKNVNKFRVYQINPTSHPILFKLNMVKAKRSDVIINSKEIYLNPFGADFLDFNMSDILLKDDDEMIRFTSNTLPSVNCKPVVFTYFNNNKFTVNHS